MIKSFSATCACILLLAFTAGPAKAQISYCKDFLEPGNPGGWGDNSLKTFEDTWILSEGETVSVDIWINDVPEDLLTAGCFIKYDPALVALTNVMPYDTSNKGPWDSGMTQSFEVKPGEWFLVVGNLGCVTPDGDNDLILGKVTFEYKGPDEANITINIVPETSFDTVTGCSGKNLDSQTFPNTITINKGNGTSTTTTGSGTTTTPTSTTSPSTTTSPGTTTTTEPSSNSWQSAYAMIWGEDREQKLSLLRAFRNELVARNEVVKNYVSLLYQHSSEVAGVFIKHPLLCLEMKKLVEALLPSIESFFETEQLILTAGQKDTVETFLNQFELKIPPELKGIIQNFRKDLKDGRLFLTVS